MKPDPESMHEVEYSNRHLDQLAAGRLAFPDIHTRYYGEANYKESKWNAEHSPTHDNTFRKSDEKIIEIEHIARS